MYEFGSFDHLAALWGKWAVEKGSMLQEWFVKFLWMLWKLLPVYLPTCRLSIHFKMVRNCKLHVNTQQRHTSAIVKFIKKHVASPKYLPTCSLPTYPCRSRSHICETNLIFFPQYCAALLLGGASLHENTGTRGADKLTFDLYIGAVCGLHVE